jgi:hypothetical protein
MDHESYSNLQTKSQYSPCFSSVNNENNCSIYTKEDSSHKHKSVEEFCNTLFIHWMHHPKGLQQSYLTDLH